MDVFKHAKIARWCHCNADSVKTHPVYTALITSALSVVWMGGVNG